MKVFIGCSNCGKRIVPGNTNGLPNGVGFVQDDGTIINLCQQCLIDFGKMSKEEKDRFFTDRGWKLDK